MIPKVLIYGDSNTWGWVPGMMGAERFGTDQRWAGLVRTRLGEGFEVIEEALGARCAAHDDPRPELPLRNGLTTLPMILEAHAPLDVVVFMLGTGECKAMMGLEPTEIVRGMGALIETVQSFKAVNEKTIGQIIVIAPPVVNESAEFASKLFLGGAAKGEALREGYRLLAQRHGCAFLDSNDFVTVDADEGVHLPPEAQRLLAAPVAELIQKVLSR